MTSLSNRVVVITGAGSGIGRSLAVQAAEQGAHLALSDVDSEGLAQTLELVTAANADIRVRTDRLDVRDRASMVAYAPEIVAEFDRVNVVVNNAGVSYSGPVTELQYDDFEWIMGINFWGVVHGTQEFLPHLIDSGEGHLVNISSLFGLVSMPGQAAYNASKYAVRGYTESVREDMLIAGHPVQVTCVHPGGIKTGIARNGRVTHGEDLAELSRFFDKRLATMTPQKAARIIWDAVRANRPRQLVGMDAHAIHTIGKVLGARYQDVFSVVAKRVMP